MKVKYFYFSPTYTTKKVISKIVEGMGYKAEENNITFIKNNKEEYVVEKDEIAIIGVPVYSGRVPDIILPTLANIKGNGGPAVALCLYGNANYGDALLELKDILKKQNFTVIAGSYFIGEHSYTKKVAQGRPDANDLEIAQDFGKKIKEKIENNNFTEVTVPGKFPYKERKPKYVFSPHGNNDCVYCRQCVGVCPVGAIDKRKPDIVEEEICIHCCACIKICNFNGREINDPKILEVIKFLEENCMTRKEPEIFI